MTGAVEARVLRTIGTLFGVASAVFGLLVVPGIAGEMTVAPPAWTVAALVATLGLPLALGVAARFVRPPVTRALGAAVAVGNLLALATAPLVLGRFSGAAASPWVLQLTAIGTTGAALGLPVTLVVTDVVLTGALVVVDRSLTSDAPLGLIPLQDGAYAALFAAIFAALAVSAIRAGRSADAAAEAAMSATLRARDERVRADERSRVNGLVHDHVLTTLLVAARSPAPIASVATDAVGALQHLERLAGPQAAEDAVPTEGLLDRIRAQLTTTAPDAAFVVDGRRAAGLPARVTAALVGATGEAIRNSRRHAGAEAHLEVRVILDESGVEILVIDDGVGFVPADVPRNRLGIVTSIEARMRHAGGAAVVRSRRGSGTAVQLRWRAP